MIREYWVSTEFDGRRISLNVHQSASDKLQSWTKMLRKMHVVYVILEYFPLKPGSLKIFPPPPKKAMLKCGPNIFAAY